MPPLNKAIIEFINSNHVVSLATLDADGLWSASCFYAFDPEQVRLLILTSTDTRHGAAMLADPHISGTISGQPKNIRDIRGIQFSACALRLESMARHQALRLYTQRHPLAKLKSTDVWSLELQQIKFTDNFSLFGHKTHWVRQQAGDSPQ
jgi:uncharacterized protein YhbP (UPF0306 family)